jgi:hypothetical protein
MNWFSLYFPLIDNFGEVPPSENYLNYVLLCYTNTTYDAMYHWASHVVLFAEKVHVDDVSILFSTRQTNWYTRGAEEKIKVVGVFIFSRLNFLFLLSDVVNKNRYHPDAYERFVLGLRWIALSRGFLWYFPTAVTSSILLGDKK